MLLKDKEMFQRSWPLAGIVGVHPGPDGHIRVVTIKTEKGTYRRPIVKLFLFWIRRHHPRPRRMFRHREDPHTGNRKRGGTPLQKRNMSIELMTFSLHTHSPIICQGYCSSFDACLFMFVIRCSSCFLLLLGSFFTCGLYVLCKVIKGYSRSACFRVGSHNLVLLTGSFTWKCSISLFCLPTAACSAG